MGEKDTNRHHKVTECIYQAVQAWTSVSVLEEGLNSTFHMGRLPVPHTSTFNLAISLQVLKRYSHGMRIQTVS